MAAPTLVATELQLLDIMREADDEAVTFAELEIAGVGEPQRALRMLELAGFTFDHVIDRTSRGEEVECVRLAADHLLDLSVPAEIEISTAAVPRKPSAPVRTRSRGRRAPIGRHAGNPSLYSVLLVALLALLTLGAATAVARGR